MQKIYGNGGGGGTGGTVARTSRGISQQARGVTRAQATRLSRSRGFGGQNVVGARRGR